MMLRVRVRESVTNAKSARRAPVVTKKVQLCSPRRYLADNLAEMLCPTMSTGDLEAHGTDALELR
jgi:hypothetical protein